MGYNRKWLAAQKINFLTGTASLAMITSQGVIYGWAFEETTGLAVAQIELIDGSSDNGDRIVPITLLANESTRDIWGWPGIWCDRGVFCRVVAGSVRGTIYYKSMTDEEANRFLTANDPVPSGG